MNVTAFEIVYQALNGEPKPGKKAWTEFRKEWEARKNPGLGTCCFCGKQKEVCNVTESSNSITTFGLGNFTDFPRRLHKGTEVCIECLAVLKEYNLSNLSLLYFIALGEKFTRNGKNEPVIDGRLLFKPQDDKKHGASDGRKGFLNRLLNPPDSPFICGRKEKSYHRIPFSPVNAPGAKVIQVYYMSSIAYFDLERHRQIVEDARAYWQRGEMSEALKAHKDTPVGAMILELTEPAENPKSKSKSKNKKAKRSD